MKKVLYIAAFNLLAALLFIPLSGAVDSVESSNERGHGDGLDDYSQSFQIFPEREDTRGYFATQALMDSGCDDCLTIHLTESMVAEGYGSCPFPDQDVRAYFGQNGTDPKDEVGQSVEQSKENGTT